MATTRDRHPFGGKWKITETEMLEEKLERMDRSRLAWESAKLDPASEIALAEEGLSEKLRDWPEY